MDNEPMMILESDDDKSMTSELRVGVDKQLRVCELIHMRQNGSEETIILYPHQLELMANFMLEMKAWIDSKFDPNLQPKSYNEFDNG